MKCKEIYTIYVLQILRNYCVNLQCFCVRVKRSPSNIQIISVLQSMKIWSNPFQIVSVYLFPLSSLCHVEQTISLEINGPQIRKPSVVLICSFFASFPLSFVST